MGVITNVQHATHRIGRHLETVLAAVGVDQAEAHVLSALAAGPMTVAALVQTVGVKRSTLTNILDRLERRGLVSREINPRDRRSFVVRPSRGGERAAKKVAAAFAAVDANLARATTASEREAFDAVLARLEEIL
jgi:MarR family transcriptional regulator, organic hydroperoxide resistance regulator